MVLVVIGILAFSTTPMAGIDVVPAQPPLGSHAPVPAAGPGVLVTGHPRESANPRPAATSPVPAGANVMATIRVGANPAYPCYDPADGDIYVPTYGAVLAGGNNISIVSGATNQLIATRSVGDDPIAAVYDAGDQDVYVLNFGLSDNLTVLHGTTIVAWVGVGAAPIGAVYDSGNGFLYVSNFQSANVSVVSGTGVVASVNVGTNPTTPVYDPVNGNVYVPNAGSNNVTVIKGSSVIATISVGTNPNPGVYDSGNGHIYFPNTGSGNVSIIAGTTLLGNVSVGTSGSSSPYSANYDPTSGLVYVPCTGSDVVSMIDAGNNVTNVSVGQAPRQSVYDPTTGDMYVTSLLAGNVTMFNATTIVASIDTGLGPFAGVFDSGNSETYVTDYNSNNLTAIGTNLSGYIVYFNETGLPSGATWGAKIGPTTFFSSTRSIAFSQPNGPFNYTIRPVAGYTVNGTGSAVVSGQDLVVSITFRELFEIPFQETGLAPGTDWNVSIGTVRNDSITPLVELFEPNGSYAYSIRPISGYSTTWSGGVTVLGRHSAVNVTFVRVTYSLQFSESGLPGGTVWRVSVGGSPTSSTLPTISFNEPNGTFPYVVDPVPGYSGNLAGNVSLNGTGHVVPVVFEAVYALTFHETGLPAGTRWSVSIAASTNTSTSSSIGFWEPNGSSAYTIGPVPGYSGGGTGSVVVSGAPASVPIHFVAVFTVTFRESGLLAGTHWSVELGSARNASTTSVIGFTESNGSYPYAVGPVPGFADVPSGLVSVDGPAAPITVAFVAAYAVTFAESGLPTGTSWGVTVGILLNRSTTQSLNFSLENGVHPYRVSALPGYRALWTGNVTVAGASRRVVIPFILDEYSVTFDERGLVDATDWTVALNGTAKDSTTSFLTFQEPNGTYLYSIPLVSGYAGQRSGTVLVHGATPPAVNVSFGAETGPRGGLAAVSVQDWAAVGIASAALVVGLVWLRRRKGRPVDGSVDDGLAPSSDPPSESLQTTS